MKPHSMQKRTTRAAFVLGFALLPGAWLTAAPTHAAPQLGRRSVSDELGPLVDITREQELAVENGLRWLAKDQNQDGSWTANIGFKLNSTYRITAQGR